MVVDLNLLLENRLFHEIHVSEIREYQKCHWAWWWKYHDKLYPKHTAEPLEFGTAMHAGMEARYDPKYWDQREIAEALAVVAFDKKNTEQLNLAKKAKGIFFDQSVVDMYEERRDLGLRMLQYYFDNISSNEKDFKPLAVEQNFVVPIPDTSCVCDECFSKWHNFSSNPDDVFTGLPVVLEGKIDLVLEYAHSGKVWVRDWKNIGRFSNSVEWLENDLQLNLYLWALWKLGADIGGFEYFESKKAVPAAPEPMKRRSGGRLFSVDKTKSYEYDSYLKEVKLWDTEAYDAGLYDDYLRWLQSEGPQYYRMSVVRKTTAAMKVLESILKSIAGEITHWRRLGSYDDLPFSARPAYDLYPSPTKFGCIYCEFRQPCIERMNGQPYDGLIESLFNKKEKHYYE